MKEYFRQNKILAKINKGDEAAFMEMYNYYAPKLFRHACFRLSSRELAEDIAQQVFYKTWQYIINPKNKIDNLNAFLYKTINNLITDHYRLATKETLPLDDVIEDHGNKIFNEPSYEVEIDSDLEKIKVRESIKLLKPEQQELIAWRYLDDLTTAEISKISGKSSGAIYVGIHRALKELRKVIV